MDFLLFHVFLLPGTNILRWEWEELQANFAYFFFTIFYDVCCVLHRVSQIVCLLPGSGRGPETELQSDQAGFALKQHWP